MASAKSLRAGLICIINSGPLVGRQAEVIDPTVIPDGMPNQRKVLVKVLDPNTSWEEYIIPKQLSIPGLAPVSNTGMAMMPPPPPPMVQFQPPALPISAPQHHVPQPVAEVVVRTVTPITSLDDPALDRYRPSRANLLKQYVSRVLPGGKKDIEVMMAYWRRRNDNGYADNVGLVGDTQSGKTMLVEVLAYTIAKEMGLSKPLPVFTLSGSSAITDHDLFGQYRPNDNNELVWMEGIVALACRVGGILYLDEVNAMPGNVTAALHPILDDRRQFVNIRKPVEDGHGGWQPEVVNVNTDLWVMCTYNPGYAGMSKTNEAFANRFRWLPWDYDEGVEERLIKSPAIRLLGQALRLARETRAITTPIGTSALQRLEQDLTYLSDVDFALWAFMGQFPSKAEKAKVDAIITDRNIRALVEAEFKPEAAPVDNTTAQVSPDDLPF